MNERTKETPIKRKEKAKRMKDIFKKRQQNKEINKGKIGKEEWKGN